MLVSSSMMGGICVSNCGCWGLEMLATAGRTCVGGSMRLRMNFGSSIVTVLLLTFSSSSSGASDFSADCYFLMLVLRAEVFWDGTDCFVLAAVV